MSTIALLVVLLLALVSVLFMGALAYTAHRFPAAIQPLTLALIGAGTLAAVVTIVVTVGAG